MNVKLMVPNCKSEEIFGVEHVVVDFTNRRSENNLIFKMHDTENFNNIEVLKFAMAYKRMGYSLTAYGMLNQLPLFGMFADRAILQANKDWSKNVYPKEGEKSNFTTYEMRDLFPRVSRGFDKAFDLKRPPGSPVDWPQFLMESELAISDEEVAEEFKSPTVFVRREALEKYEELKKDFISKNTIMCEVKINEHSGGQHLIDIFKSKLNGYEVPVCTSLSYRRELCERSGMDLMSVQLMASLDSNWMWIAYGGASNILPFFPIKILSLSDAYCRPELTRAISLKRFGTIGEIFPEFQTLIYCFPGEEDGPSRTDGHPPLPDLRKFVVDFSIHQITLGTQ